MDQEVSPSVFTLITDTPIDPIFGLNDLFRNDPRGERINLTYGICLEEDGSLPKVFHSVKKAEEAIFKGEKTKNYLPIEGDPEYIRETGRFLLGKHYQEKTLYGAQTVGGTSALRIICDFIQQEVTQMVSISHPTWANHPQILEHVGSGIDRYPYWKDGRFDFQRLYDHIAGLPKKTVVQLQPMGHNPTGIDLSLSEWKELSSLFHKNGLIPFFDSAYQGLCRGLIEDVLPIHLFIEDDHECFIAHSFSKSMALYGERVGALYIKMRRPQDKDAVHRKVSSIIRTHYSNPPKHGSSIAKTLLSRADLFHLWSDELASLRIRIQKTRGLFAEKLTQALQRDFSYMKKGCGLFVLLGLTPSQIQLLLEKHAIYVTQGGRVNLAALNSSNLDTVVHAIASVSKG